MKKLFVISFIFIILLNLLSTFVSAESINIYDQLNENTVEEEISSTTPEISQAKVSTMSSVSQANLNLNNILCIILIAIGILLILLAIAILIKLKN